MKQSKLLTIPQPAARMLLAPTHLRRLFVALVVLLTMAAQTAWADGLSGDGSSENPYLISSATDWNTFASSVNNGTTYENLNVKLTTDISVTAMVGTSDNPFKGIFDGNGKTLTVTIDGTEAKCAPFHFVNGATIKYLRVAGSVTSTRSNSAGIIGEILGGTVNIKNCISSVTITNNMDNDGTSNNNAGIVGRLAAGSVTIENCLFNGDLHQGNSDNVLNAGMLGWAAGEYITFKQCLFAPSGITMNHDSKDNGSSRTFYRGNSSSTMTDCYYTVSFGEIQGQAVGDMTNEQLAAALGDGWVVKNNKVVPVMPIDATKLDDAVVSGLSKTYMWENGSAITISYSVAAGDATPLTEGTHYTAVIKKGDDVVSEVKDVGDYSLTITAKDGSSYTGYQILNFSVVDIQNVLSVDNDFTKGQDGYYYLNMPASWMSNYTVTLPEGFTSAFKVYDDGGKNNNYSENCKGTLVLTAPAGYVLQLSGKVTTETNNDYLDVYDGNGKNGTKLLNEVSSASDGTPIDIPTVYSSGQSMTLYFLSDQVSQYSGLELTVRLIGNTDYNITVNTATGGSITSDKSTAKPGETVTLTVGNATSGYMLSGVNVLCGSSETVPVNWDGMTDNTITFTMPSGDVSATPVFTNTLTAANGLFINMPATGSTSFAIPDNVQSFKVYDNGGKNGNYSSNNEGTLVLTAPNGSVLQLTGSVKTAIVDDRDYLIVYDGNNTSGTKLLPQTHSIEDNVEKAFSPVVSSGQSMTLYFKTDNDYNYAGLDLTVTVGNATSNNNITVNTATGGSITSIDKTSAKANETVTLTATPTEGYLLKEIIVSDGSITYPVTNGNWHSSNTATFSMPITAVSVTPIFTDNLTVDGGLYINMPKTGNKTVSIPSGVGSFKVYDDGGENDLYSDNCNGTLTLTAPEGYVLQLSGNIKIEQDHDKLDVYNGSTTSDSKLLDGVSSNNYWEVTAITTVTSSGQSMMLSFHSDNNGVKYAGLDLTVTLVPITYTVSFQKNNNDATGTMDAQTHTYDAQLALTANSFEYTGYAFAGWATSADGDVVYTDQAEVSNLTTTQGANVELFAKWTAIEYTITYNGVNGATFETANPTTYTIESDAITLNNPTREGYTFAGWTGTGLTDATTTVTIAHGSTGNREYTATWKKLLTNTDITVTIPSMEWTGSALTPTITVKDGETTLTETTDYTVSLPVGRTNSGDYTVTLTGAGNYDGTTTETFTITPKVLEAHGAINICQDQNGTTAFIDGSSEDAVSITSNVTVEHVTYNRTFTAGKCATVMLPFEYTCNGNEGGTFYEFAGVEQENSQWIATMRDAEDPVNKVTTLVANKPYLFMPSGTAMTFTGGATLNTTGGGGQQTADAGSNWTFKGTYAARYWYDGTDANYPAQNSDEIGKAYGFAGVPKTGIEVGDFVRVASGAKIRPMGCYLLWSDTQNAAPARGMTRAAAVTNCPSRITVRLVGSNGETTGIGELDTRTGEISTDGWWTLDGAKLSGKPARKGLYIHNGRKEVLK